MAGGTGGEGTATPGGGRPFVFVSYAEADRGQVTPELDRLRRLGYRLWHPEVALAGLDRAQAVATALDACSACLVFVTTGVGDSRDVAAEVTYALSQKQPFLAIHLDEAARLGGLRLQMASRAKVLTWCMDEREYVERVRRNLPDRTREATGRLGEGARQKRLCELAQAQQVRALSHDELLELADQFEGLGLDRRAARAREAAGVSDAAGGETTPTALAADAGDQPEAPPQRTCPHCGAGYKRAKQRHCYVCGGTLAMETMLPETPAQRTRRLVRQARVGSLVLLVAAYLLLVVVPDVVTTVQFRRAGRLADPAERREAFERLVRRGHRGLRMGLDFYQEPFLDGELRPDLVAAIGRLGDAAGPVAPLLVDRWGQSRNLAVPGLEPVEEAAIEQALIAIGRPTARELGRRLHAYMSSGWGTPAPPTALDLLSRLGSDAAPAVPAIRDLIEHETDKWVQQANLAGPHKPADWLAKAAQVLGEVGAEAGPAGPALAAVLDRVPVLPTQQATLQALRRIGPAAGPEAREAVSAVLRRASIGHRPAAGPLVGWDVEDLATLAASARATLAALPAGAAAGSGEAAKR